MICHLPVTGVSHLPVDIPAREAQPSRTSEREFSTGPASPDVHHRLSSQLGPAGISTPVPQSPSPLPGTAEVPAHLWRPQQAAPSSLCSHISAYLLWDHQECISRIPASSLPSSPHPCRCFPRLPQGPSSPAQILVTGSTPGGVLVRADG